MCCPLCIYLHFLFVYLYLYLSSLVLSCIRSRLLQHEQRRSCTRWSGPGFVPRSSPTGQALGLLPKGHRFEPFRLDIYDGCVCRLEDNLYLVLKKEVVHHVNFLLQRHFLQDIFPKEKKHEHGIIDIDISTYSQDAPLRGKKRKKKSL